MWILPKSLMSLCATATAESTSDSIESLALKYEPLLFARSKPLQSKMLLRKWKQGQFLRLRSGMILNPSLGDLFTGRWTSYLEGSLANHSQQQGSGKEATIPATCSHTSLTESGQLDLPLFSSKTSMESSVPNSGKDGEIQQERRFCSMSSANWKEWVTAQRQEYSVRAKSAHHTSESGSSSLAWPTVTVAEAGKISCCPNYGQLGLSNHPEVHGYSVDREKLAKSGRPDQENHSTDGSRPASLETNWITPQVQDHKHSGTNPTANGQRDLLVNQVNWQSPRSCEWKGNGPKSKQQGLCNQVVPEQSATKATGKLNPRWGETLMGLPVGWTMPSCARPVTIEPTNCDCSGTGSSLQQQSALSVC